jgi:UDP-3-O-[3-hydroxymyristoyl] glucosamine N-acyltransferase
VRAGIRLRELAAELGRPFEGDGELVVRGVAALERAGPEDLVHARSERYAAALRASRAGAVIAPPGLDTGALAAIRSPNPGLDFARAARRLAPPPPVAPGVHPSALVATDAQVDAGASVGPGCVVGARARIGSGSVLHARVVLYADVEIGAGCVVHAGCVLREGTRLGERVVLQPGVVLGSDGFGYAMDGEGRLEALPRLGCVVVEDDVEIGAHATVDRGSLGETRIGRNAKLDNLVQVAHNASIGESAIVVAQSGIAGSAVVGARALVMAQAGIADHVQVGERAFVGPRSGVRGDVAAGERVMGSPHRELGAFRRIWGALALLPGVLRRLRALERRAGIAPGEGAGPDERGAGAGGERGAEREP